MLASGRLELGCRDAIRHKVNVIDARWQERDQLLHATRTDRNEAMNDRRVMREEVVIVLLVAVADADAA